MKEIATTNKAIGKARSEDIIQSLDLPKQEYIRAALMPKICNLTPKDVSDDLIDCIVAAHNNSGQVVDVDSVLVQANETYVALMKLFPDVTVEEVRQAIRNGVYGTEKYFGLNPKTYVQFVRSYLQSNERSEAKARYESEKLKAREKPPPLTEQQIQEAIEHDYKVFKEMGRDFVPFAIFKYRYLRQRKFIKLTNESWQKSLAISKNELYWRRSEAAKKKGDKSTLNEILKLTTEIEQHGTLPITELKKIAFNARRLRYLYFFEVMQKNEFKTIF